MSGLYPVVILAGGLATRLRPLTETIPKALVPIQGEPFIAHQLRLLRKRGIEEVIICAGYLGEMLEQFVGNGCGFDLQVHFSLEKDALRGTAGAINQAQGLLPNQFFVLYGDSYLPCDYAGIQAAFEHSQKPALMTVFKNKNQWDRSNICYENGYILRYDKLNQDETMRHIDYGLGVFNKDIFTALPLTGHYDLADLYQELLQKQQLAAYEVPQRFYEVGSFAGLNELSEYLSNRTPHPRLRRDLSHKEKGD